MRDQFQHSHVGSPQAYPPPSLGDISPSTEINLRPHPPLSSWLTQADRLHGHDAQPIVPLEGEMSDRTEGGDAAETFEVHS